VPSHVLLKFILWLKGQRKSLAVKMRTKKNYGLMQARYSGFDMVEEKEDFALMFLSFFMNPSTASTQPTNQ